MNGNGGLPAKVDKLLDWLFEGEQEAQLGKERNKAMEEQGWSAFDKPLDSSSSEAPMSVSKATQPSDYRFQKPYQIPGWVPTEVLYQRFVDMGRKDAHPFNVVLPATWLAALEEAGFVYRCEGCGDFHATSKLLKNDPV